MSWWCVCVYVCLCVCVCVCVCVYIHTHTQLVEALRYKPEGRGFDSRWCHWNFSLTQSLLPHYGPGVDSASDRNEYQYCILTHNLHTFSKPTYISCQMYWHVKDLSKRILSRSLGRIGVGTKSRHGAEHTCISYGASSGRNILLCPTFHVIWFTHTFCPLSEFIYMSVCLFVRFYNLLWLFTIYIFWILNFDV